MTVIIVPQQAPTHETESRCYTDDAGRQIAVSVRARIGAGTARPFSQLPGSWERDREAEKDELSPFGAWGILLAVLFAGGMLLFFGAILLDVAGWLPKVEWESGFDPLGKFWGWSFHYYIRGALALAAIGFVAACLAALFQRKP